MVAINDSPRLAETRSGQGMEIRQNLREKKELIFVLICAVFLYLHLFVFNAVPFFYEEDHLLFIQDAWRMYCGESLYKDFFQLTFPGTQLLYLGLLYIFGTKFWLINAVIFLQGFTQTLICLAISKRVIGGGWNAFLPPSLFLFFGFRWFGIDGSHRMLSPIFVWLAILILLKGRTYQRVALSGLLCALASYFTQQRGMLAAGAIAFFLLFETIKNKSDWKKLAVQELLLGGSFVLLLFVLILPFLIAAGPNTFFEYTFLSIKDYVQDPEANYGAYIILFEKVWGQGVVVSAAMCFYYALTPMVYLAGFVYLWKKKNRAEIWLIALVGCFLALGTFAPTPMRFFQISVPAIIIFCWLIFQIRFRSELFARSAVTLLVIFGGVLAVRLQTNWDRLYLYTPTGKIAFLSPVTLERYKWLSEHAEPNEYVFEAYQTAVNFPLQLPNPTQVMFLLDRGITTEWQVQLAIKNLEQKKPRFIVWDAKWSKENSERNPGDKLAPLYDYLRQNYEIKQNFTPYSDREMQAWQRKI